MPAFDPAGNIDSGGSLNAIEMTRAPSASFLPVRRKNGTPAQRQLSISILQRDEGLGVGVLRDLLLAAVAAVLAADDVVRLDRLHRAEHLELLVADRARQERGGRLHRHEREHLHQVGDHHVAVGAGGLVERRAALEAERLGHVDLHVLDEVAVPDRLEEPVGEAEREDVLRRLLAEEVVDPEDLRLVEDLVHLVVEGHGGREVGAERLLHDDPRPLDQAGLVELVDHVERRLGRHREVVQEAYVALDAELRRGLAHRVGQRVRPVALRDVGEHRGEPLPLPVVELALAELRAGVPAPLDELRGVHVLQRGADDPGVLEQAGLGEPQQPGQQLAPGQVAGRTEEHDDVRGGHRVDARAHKLPRYYALDGDSSTDTSRDALSARSSRSAFHCDSAYSLSTSECTVMPAAGAEPVGAVAGRGERPDDHAEVGAAVGGEPAERAGVRPSRGVLDVGDHLHRAQLGRSGHRARREQRAQRADRGDVVAQPAADRARPAGARWGRTRPPAAPAPRRCRPRRPSPGRCGAGR